MSSYGGRILAALIILAVAIWAGLSYLANRSPVNGPPSNASPSSVEAAGQYSLAIRHSVTGAAHTYVGSVQVPACEALSAGLQSTGVSPAHLTVLLEFRSIPSCSGGASASEDFSLSYDIGKGMQAPVVDGVTLNGTAATFSLVEPR